MVDIRRRKADLFVREQTGASVLFTRVQNWSFLTWAMMRRGLGWVALSGLVVGVPAASSQGLLQMRRLKAAEHRLMLWKEFLGSHDQH